MNDYNEFSECRKSIYKQYETSDNKLWYCLVESLNCQKITNKYYALWDSISKLTNKLLIVKKNEQIKTKIGYEYIPSFRPPGGYLRYALFMEQKDRNFLKYYLEECLTARIKHHYLCESPDSIPMHENEKQYLQNAILILQEDTITIEISVSLKLLEELNYIKNIINDPKISKTLKKNCEKILELRKQNRDNFESNKLCGWITDDGFEFRIKDS
jgi:hypothetical protein